MRKSTTLDWIEQAEAARVLSDATFAEEPGTASCRAAIAALTAWRARVCSWLMPAQPGGSQMEQAQPLPLRTTHPQPANDDHHFGCDW